MTKKQDGRPTKLTPEVQKKIVDAVEAGNYIETAANYAGISKDTLYRWLKEGARAKSGKKRAFSDAIEKALAKAEMRDVFIIGKAAEQHWQAAAWRLERKFPNKWGRVKHELTAHHEVTGKGGGPIETKHTEEQHIIHELVSDPEIGGKIEELFKRPTIQSEGEE